MRLRGLFKRGDPEKKRVEEKIKDLRDLINLLDAYQFNHFRDYNRLDGVINNGLLGKEVLSTWREVKPKLIRMAKISRHPPEVIGLMKRKTIVGVAESMGLAVVSLALVLSFIIRIGFTIFLFFIGVSFFNVGLIFVAFYIDYKISLKLVEYFKEHPDKYGSSRSVLRRWTQELIYTYSGYIRQINGAPKKYDIKLFDIDYEGIKVVKKPRLWRKHYIVHVEI